MISCINKQIELEKSGAHICLMAGRNEMDMYVHSTKITFCCFEEEVVRWLDTGMRRLRIKAGTLNSVLVELLFVLLYWKSICIYKSIDMHSHWQSSFNYNTREYDFVLIKKTMCTCKCKNKNSKAPELNYDLIICML